MTSTLALLAAAFAALLSVGGCSGGTSPVAAARHPSPSAAEPLFLGDGSVISVVDGATGQVQRRMPAGAPSPDWSRLYSVAGSYAKVIRAIRTLQGRTRDFEAYYRALFDTYPRLPALKDELRTAIEGPGYKRKR